jgi:hypothetical protein
MRATSTRKRDRYDRPLMSDGTIDRTFKGPVPLNRSKRWEQFNHQRPTTYQEARDKSPSSRPVR